MERKSEQHLHEGMTLSGLRNHNERLVLTTIQKLGSLAGVEISRATGLSAQTASVILRALEEDGLVERGSPVRGKVGKPLTPWELVPGGACAFGLRVGRRQADFVVLDFSGQIQGALRASYPYPTPGRVLEFVRDGLSRFARQFDMSRVAGIGIAAPFELWSWLDIVGAPKAEMMAWKGFSFADALAEITDLPVFLGNDASYACAAELAFGHGRTLLDFAYFNLDSFIGGGVVLNGRLHAGRTGNAGAFGSLPVPRGHGAGVRVSPERPTPPPEQPLGQLLEHASLYLLEQRVAQETALPDGLDLDPEVWARFEAHVAPWIAECGRYLALGAVAVTAVIDFEAVVIDGRFPVQVRDRLVAATRQELAALNTQGIALPKVVGGVVGPKASALGAANQPIRSTFFLGNAPMA